jgi:hypothetical protein
MVHMGLLIWAALPLCIFVGIIDKTGRKPYPTMQRFKLKSEIHNATITGADLHYEGSLAIDAELMREVRIEEYEQVHHYNVTNGARAAIDDRDLPIEDLYLAL